MVDATRALLDELMGKERNVPLTERSGRRLRFDDPAVCKYDLGGLCPHGLFRNTKSDLGACTYEVHSDHIDWQAIKEEYEKQDDREKERYEKKLMGYLDELIREMDRKIAKARERAEKESAPRPIKADDQLRLDELNQRAKDALEKSQKLGEEGDVDAAMMLSQQAEAYKKQYDEMFRRLTAPERTMTVCEVCGVFISATDMDKERWGGKVPQPILDHLNGKQYLGWKAVREQHAKLKEKYGSAAAAAAGTSHRERDRSRGRDDRDRERDRSERDRGDRDRERDRDRGSGYERDRGGGGYDRAGYDRSRDRGGYDRGYERDRERGGGYGSYGGRERDRYPEERRRY